MRTVCALPRREACRGYPCVGAACLLLSSDAIRSHEGHDGSPSEPRQRTEAAISLLRTGPTQGQQDSTFHHRQYTVLLCWYWGPT